MTGTLEDDMNTSSLSSLFFTISPYFSGSTLCTEVLDLDKQAPSVIEGNLKKGEISHVFSISLKESKMLQ